MMSDHDVGWPEAALAFGTLVFLVAVAIGATFGGM